MSQVSSDLAAAFISWFQSNKGFLDTSMGIAAFPGQGHGAIALKDIPEGCTLFTIPRSLTLSTRTSLLPGLLGDAWQRFKLDKGWAGLILCMMWEEANGPASLWSEYLSSLPSRFDTPMFWSAEDLNELKGTAVVDKIGKEEADIDYREKLVPVSQARPDLFPLHLITQFYSLERFHIMGSRILSRSFRVLKWRGDGDENVSANNSMGSAMDVDEESIVRKNEAGVREETEDDSEDEDVEDPSEVAMVPMADILNARHGSENAKLFYEEKDLKMITTKPINAGDQIWNTYGDPPNSDLLRRYGHVDLVQMPEGGLGNPGDIVEVRADLVVSVVSSDLSSSQERIDWWLEEGGDDVFVLEGGSGLPIPEEFVSLIRLLLLTQDEWEKARSKEKLPKPKIDEQVLEIAIEVLLRRLAEYPTAVQVDEALLENIKILSLNKRHAIIVRLGEKRILASAADRLRRLLQVNGEKSMQKDNEKRLKRTFEGDVGQAVGTKKSKR